MPRTLSSQVRQTLLAVAGEPNRYVREAAMKYLKKCKLAEDEAQGIDQVHPEIEHGAASRVLRLEAPRDRTAGIQVAAVEAARAPMPHLAYGSFGNERAGLHDRRVVAHNEPHLGGALDLEGAAGQRLGLVRRAADGLLHVDRAIRVERRPRLIGVAIVAAGYVHQLQLGIRESFLDGLDHPRHPQGLRLRTHGIEPLADDCAHLRDDGSGPYHRKAAQRG